jgi:hypothetical protein
VSRGTSFYFLFSFSYFFILFSIFFLSFFSPLSFFFFPERKLALYRRWAEYRGHVLFTASGTVFNLFSLQEELRSSDKSEKMGKEEKDLSLSLSLSRSELGL